MKNICCVCTAFVLSLFCLPSVLYGSERIPFFEGFDNADVEKRWVFNAGKNMDKRLTNKWCVSGHKPYMGDSCLIISDNNSTPTYTADKTNTSVAYVEFTLPAGDYDLSFAWRCVGESGKDGLYVCWEPQSTVINSSVGLKPSALNNALRFRTDSVQLLCGHRTWQLAEKRVTVKSIDSAPVAYRLYFAWYNDGAGASDMAVSIDNVQLAPAGCGKPADIEYKLVNNVAELSWKGAVAAEYEVMYRRYGSRLTDTLPGRVSGNRVPLPNLTAEGVYDFFVRGICASGDTTVWSVLSNKLLYFPKDYRIDYIDMTAKETEYTVGTYANPYSTPCQPVDSGADNWQQSRHTLHYMPDETDPYTGNRLKTVSPNAVASVRIGNSEGRGAESVSYTCKLKPDENTVLLIDYAIVYENPSHETVGEQPNVQIEVLDENGDLINPCHEVYFYPPLEGDVLRDTTWQPQPGINGKDNVLWRDWHTMGINLQQLAGEAERTIKVRLTVRDCIYSPGHFAHAFFSIRSTSASIDGYSCGNTGADLTATAPPGFDYEWYRPEDPDSIWGRGQTFSIDASDADTFECRLIFKGNPECDFTLPAYLIPRVPVADFVPERSSRKCENRLLLRNTGGVMSNGVLTNEQCEHTWTITDLNTGRDSIITDVVNPELLLPDWGDTISVQLSTKWLHCNSNKTDTIIIPPITHQRDTLVRQVCRLPYLFGNTLCDTVGQYLINYGTDNAGCPIELLLDVQLMSKRDSVLYDTICHGETYLFGDFKYTTPSPAEGYVRTIKTANGECDSIVIMLHLDVIPPLTAVLEPQPEICADADRFEVQCLLSSDDISGYSLTFGSKARRAGFADIANADLNADETMTIKMPDAPVRPDWYDAEVLLHTERCGSVAVPLSFTVSYPTTGVMVQKWNDVLALLNREHNCGGFEYEAYQWYRNGEKIDGATASYLYIGGEGERFEPGDEYTVLLTRVGDTAGIMTCPFVPEKRVDKSAPVVLRQPQGARAVFLQPTPQESGVARWYAPSGVLVKECAVDGAVGAIALPDAPGVYVLNVAIEGEVYNFKVINQ